MLPVQILYALRDLYAALAVVVSIFFISISFVVCRLFVFPFVRFLGVLFVLHRKISTGCRLVLVKIFSFSFCTVLLYCVRNECAH